MRNREIEGTMSDGNRFAVDACRPPAIFEALSNLKCGQHSLASSAVVTSVMDQLVQPAIADAALAGFSLIFHDVGNNAFKTDDDENDHEKMDDPKKDYAGDDRRTRI